MRRITHFYRGSHIPAATLNRMQSEGINLVAASENPASAGVDVARVLSGANGLYACTQGTGLGNTATRVLDTSLDWRNRVVEGVFFRLVSAAQRLHDTDAWEVNDPTQALAVRHFAGGRLGAGTATPSVLSSTSPTVIVDELASTSQRVFLYARSSDGALCLYNGSGATLHAELFLRAYSEAEALGTGPSPVPTLTDLLYLGQGNVADRPAPDTVDRGVYYASDEGVFYYWDGALWLPWGGSSSGPTSITGDVSTTDATWTSIATVAMDPSTSTTLRISVTAIRDDGTEGGGWELVGRYRRPSSGSVVAGAETFLLADHDGTGWDARVTPGASGLTIEVAGEAAKNLNWRCTGSATSRSA